jgi:hypothetical protein
VTRESRQFGMRLVRVASLRAAVWPRGTVRF